MACNRRFFKSEATDLFFASGTTGLNHHIKKPPKKRKTQSEGDEGDADQQQESDSGEYKGVSSIEYRHLLAGTGPYSGALGLVAQAASVFARASVRNWSWQQDGARAHFAGKSKNGDATRTLLLSLLTSGATFIDDWPPHSPDLSPIENVWRQVEHVLWTQHSWDDFEGFKRELRLAWREVTSDRQYLSKTCQSFYRRMRACVRARGGETGW